MHGAPAAALPVNLLREIFPHESHCRLWLVGGSVRDILSGRDIRDIDLVAILPEDLLQRLGFRFVTPVSSAPVWFRNVHGLGTVEVTRLDDRRALTKDLRRRDFTVNAILMSLDGDISDPLGGVPDLKNRTLRLCRDNAFSRDPVRIFRAFRFAAEGFSIPDATERLIRSRNWDEELKKIPVERFAREMQKALPGSRPWLFFDWMIKTGAGRCYLPELFTMSAVPAGPPEHHPEGDLLSHSREVLERVSAMTDNPMARFCAMFHDIGKLQTEPAVYPTHHGHEDAGAGSAVGFCRRLALPSAYGRALSWTCRLHGSVNRFRQLRPATRVAVAAKALRAGIADILPLISAADKPDGCAGDIWAAAVAVAAADTASLGIDMERFLLMSPGDRAKLVLQKRVELLKRRAAVRP